MRLSRGQGRPRISRRFLIAAAAAALAAAALALGVIAPPASSGSGDARFAGGPQLLVSIYGGGESALWLVDPAEPSRRQALFPLAHAPGWAPAGAVSPAGGRMALLVVPPGAADPATDTLLLLSDGGPPRVVARGLDLRGGLAWSPDGAEVFARRALPGAAGRGASSWSCSTSAMAATCPPSGRCWNAATWAGSTRWGGRAADRPTPSRWGRAAAR